MSNLRTLKERTVSVKKTKKITQAMNMVAAAKFRKSQNTLISLRPYCDKLSDILKDILNRNPSIHHKLLRKGESNKTLYVVIGSDKGLCGGFNHNILKAFKEQLKDNNLDVIAIGNKIIRGIKNNENINIIAEYKNFFDTLSYESAIEFGEKVSDLFINSNYQKVVLVFNKFENALTQKVTFDQLLPINVTIKENNETLSNYIYEPSKSSVLDKLLKQYIHYEFFRVFFESFTGEQGSRMTAMDSANQNADEMIRELTLLYNRARQAAITTELSEIVAGVEALVS